MSFEKGGELQEVTTKIVTHVLPLKKYMNSLLIRIHTGFRITFTPALN